MVIPSSARFLKRIISGFAEFVDIGCFDQGRQLERGLQIESKPSPSLRRLRLLGTAWPGLAQYGWLNRWHSAGQCSGGRDGADKLLTIWAPSNAGAGCLCFTQLVPASWRVNDPCWYIILAPWESSVWKRITATRTRESQIKAWTLLFLWYKSLFFLRYHYILLSDIHLTHSISL